MFDVWTKNFANFFATFLVVALAEGVIFVLLFFALFERWEYGGAFGPGFGTPTTPTDLPRLTLYLILAAIAAVILRSIVIGGMTEYAVRRHRGESLALGQALRAGLRRFLSILGANLLISLLVAAIIVVPTGVIFAAAFGPASDLTAVLGLVCGGLLTLVVGGLFVLYVAVGTSLYAPSIMLENQGAIGGLTRSWQLTKGYRWSLLFAFLVSVVLSEVIAAAIIIPAAEVGHFAVDLVAAAVATALVGSWTLIVAAVAYDLILRTPTYGPPPYFGPAAAPPAGPTTPPPAAPPPGP